MNMATVSMCVALISLFSWIYIPFAINITLQALAIFIISSVFKPKISLSAVLIYILLGVCGLPVFSGFGAGVGTLFGPTGGYILSFAAFPLIIYIFTRNKPTSASLKFIGMSVSLVFSYVLGTLWYYISFASKSDITFTQLLCICVLPFLITDIIKILIAVTVSQRLGGYINSN